MNLKEVTELAKKYIREKASGYEIIEECTSEYNRCFVFYYQTAKFLKSRNHVDMAIGHGPLVFGKKDNKFYQFGSGVNIDAVIESFDKFDSPYYSRDWTRTIILKKEDVEIKISSLAIQVLKKIFPINTLEARQKITEFNSGKKITIEGELDESITHQLNQIGLITEIPIVYDPSI